MKKNNLIFVGVALILTLGSAGDASAQFGLFGSPRVETIDTQSLAKLMNARQAVVKQLEESGQPVPAADYVLVDVRSEKEIAVSVIPGAITKTDFEQNSTNYQNQTIIPYCTVGGRSGSYAKQLVKNGWKVKNYQGSILDWVKAELPLVTSDGQQTNRVHTYSGRYQVPEKYQAMVD